MSTSLEEKLTLALEAALEAGKAILEVYGKPHIERELKDDASPVTEADRAAHARISEILRPAGLPVLSEEGRKVDYGERREWESFWLVDPLDGTKEFLRGNGEFTVNIALIRKDEAHAGILYAPLNDLMYFAVKGNGAFLKSGFRNIWSRTLGYAGLVAQARPLPLDVRTGENDGEPIVPGGDGSMPYRVVASRSHRNRQTRRYIRKLKQKHGGLEVVSRGSALKFCLVAEGFADIYPRFGPTWEWDTAAGQAIAEAAGCSVLLEDGKTPLRYNKENLLNPWFIVKRR